MLEQVLDLLKTNNEENVGIVFQILQGNDELISELEKWFNDLTISMTRANVKLPRQEVNFINMFCEIEIKDGKIPNKHKNIESIFYWTNKETCWKQH